MRATPNDSTALMMSAREGQEEVARMLMEAGADPKTENEWGENALTWAMRHKHFRIAKWLSIRRGIRQGREGAAGNLRAGRQIRRRAAGD
ncbi:MAG: ankyrin repeat domain-containing protein [Rhodocyclaceae bacterium]|nr:ankyrin repeat domain-containing protein [Rhodocyclaceae bacterium]